ncbi:hypothetical protein GIB67_017741, partial [Kingdonia uniflora]
GVDQRCNANGKIKKKKKKEKSRTDAIVHQNQLCRVQEHQVGKSELPRILDMDAKLAAEQNTKSCADPLCYPFYEASTKDNEKGMNKEATNMEVKDQPDQFCRDQGHKVVNNEYPRCFYFLSFLWCKLFEAF